MKRKDKAVQQMKHVCVSVQDVLRRRAGAVRPILPTSASDPAAVLRPLQHAGCPLWDGLLPGHHHQPHGIGLLCHTGSAHHHLLVGHAVSAAAQQALLDDRHHLHWGADTQENIQFVIWCPVSSTLKMAVHANMHYIPELQETFLWLSFRSPSWSSTSSSLASFPSTSTS